MEWCLGELFDNLIENILLMTNFDRHWKWLLNQLSHRNQLIRYRFLLHSYYPTFSGWANFVSNLFSFLFANVKAFGGELSEIPILLKTRPWNDVMSIHGNFLESWFYFGFLIFCKFEWKLVQKISYDYLNRLKKVNKWGLASCL